MTRIGLIGAGGISELHLPAYEDHSDEATLAGVCDVDAEKAEAVAEDFGVDYWTDHETFLAEADIDAVDIALPHHVHYPVAKAALEAGKHVLIEKPLAPSLSDCVELVESADERDLTLLVGQMQRYHPPYRALKERVDAGELGQIRHARCDALVNQGDLFPEGHWLYDGEKAGGGGVIGYSVHKLDLLRYYLGDVERAAAWTRTVDDAFEDAEDYATGMLEFESGAIADFSVALSAPAMPYTESFRLLGDDGVVHTLPDGQQQEGYVGSPTPRINARDDPDRRKDFDEVAGDGTDLPTANAFVNEILHFVDCVESGAEPLTSGRDNLGTMAAIRAIYRSAARDGERVTTDEVLADAREAAR
ncbi:Gfo/Idh/MocA family protein [Halosimplex pelagicum]|uniref:Gfo/Idh/MocA family oxidoreductase n=1 Tax=Halosimplex pelagicum TaxID=869886 RepID=A0A7D5TCM9_9EURY|nr:Gfo/Idh/MocA family oxidoreductase [Halosimplex pelagicum]QLH83253.1 Gfo/Idh/MocA family oxidoreductase [Halosimplex pelagicum]